MDLGKSSMILSEKKSSVSLYVYLMILFVRLASSFPLNSPFFSLKIFAKEGRKERKQWEKRKKEKKERVIFMLFLVSLLVSGQF